MRKSARLCSDERSMQLFQERIGIANQISQAHMRLVNGCFELFVGHCIDIFIGRKPASHVGLNHHLDVRNARSNLARILHSIASAQFVEWHAVKRMKRSDEWRAEMKIPGLAEIAGVVCCGRQSQEANLGPHAVDNRPAAFLDAVLVDAVKLKRVFTRPSCLVSAVEVRRDDSSDRANSLDPARSIGTGRRRKCTDRAIEDIGQDAYRKEKTNYGDRRCDSYIFENFCSVHAFLQFLGSHVSAARQAA